MYFVKELPGGHTRFAINWIERTAAKELPEGGHTSPEWEKIDIPLTYRQE